MAAAPKCQEASCDRPAAEQDLRCALHVQRLGALTRPPEPTFAERIAPVRAVLARRRLPASVPFYAASLTLAPLIPLLVRAYFVNLAQSDWRYACLAGGVAATYGGLTVGFRGLQRADTRLGRWGGALLTMLHSVLAIPVAAMALYALGERALPMLFR